MDSTTIASILKASLPSITERADRLLDYIASETSSPAQSWKCPNTEGIVQALVCGHIYQDVTFFLDLLTERGLVRATGTGAVYPHVQITGKGYDYLAQSRAQLVGDQAFVAMWFDDSMKVAYEMAIAPAVVGAGWRALRIDRKEHANKIDDEIIAELRRSSFVIADFSCAPKQVRGGVYFEAGFAQGLGRPVIWTCRSDCVDDLHFDTRQYNHITWDEVSSFKEALERRILAVVGQGPLSK